MSKLFKFSFLILITFLIFSCSSDNDDDCPDTIIVDLDDPESIERAEACGLSPAEPLGNIWVSDNYRR